MQLVPTALASWCQRRRVDARAGLRGGGRSAAPQPPARRGLRPPRLQARTGASAREVVVAADPGRWLLQTRPHAGNGVDLIVRCHVQIPGTAQLVVTDTPASRLRAELRERHLVDVFESAEISRWLESRASAWSLTDTGSWKPSGYNAGEVNSLARVPTSAEHVAAPIYLSPRCRRAGKVTTWRAGNPVS